MKIACGEKMYDVVSYDSARKMIANNKIGVRDVTIPLSRMQAKIIENDGYKIGLRDAGDGVDYLLTPHSLNQLATRLKFGAYFLNQVMSLSDLKVNEAEIAANALNMFLRRAEQDKDHFWRLRGNTIRAVQSDRYDVIDNEFLIEVLSNVIPEGGFVHWKGNEDDIKANLLIPNSARATDESDYGGIISVGNSEVGRKICQFTPGIFRGLCSNGMVFGRQNQEPVQRKHLGKIDLVAMREMIKNRITQQLELIPQGIDRLLECQTQWLPEHLPHKNVLAQIAIQHKLTKEESGYLEPAYQMEPARSRFGIVNAVTRAAQKMSGDMWASMNEFAGELIEDQHVWSGLTKRAKLLTENEVGKYIAV